MQNAATFQGNAVTPLTSEGSIVVPPPPGQPAKEEHKTKSPVPVALAVVGAFVLIGGACAYLFFIMPRQDTVRLVDQVKPHILTLKTATSEVVDNLNVIYSLTTEQEKSPSKPNLQTTGVLIHPDVASLTNSAGILGAAISTGQKAIVEHEIREVAKLLRAAMRSLLRASPDVAGVSTPAEDPYLQTYRSLKTETVKTTESVSKAQAALAQLVSITESLPTLLPADVKGKISSSSTLKISANGYFSEAKKIAEYYQILSDTVIEMNTKISSFKTAIASAGSGFGTVLQSDNAASAKTTLSQVQVFLDQGNKDMQDMMILSQKLKAISQESLPMASGDYHAHNIQVLQVATTYFTTQSGILQELVTGAKSIVLKSEQNSLSPADMTLFRNQITIGVSQSALSDAKFASDLQSLQGEEGTLTISFWQNNTRLADGAKVADAVSAYQTSLDKLRQDNVIKGLIL